MGTVLFVAVVLGHPILTFIVLLLVLSFICFIFKVALNMLDNALDALKLRIKNFFVKK